MTETCYQAQMKSKKIYLRPLLLRHCKNEPESLGTISVGIVQEAIFPLHSFLKDENLNTESGRNSEGENLQLMIQVRNLV